MRLWLTCVLVLASASARAQPAVVTDHDQVALTAAAANVDQLAASRAKLQTRYGDQLAAVDRLKLEHASWRRDRELRASMADSNDTASRIVALDQQLAAAQRVLVAARAELVRAIDAELAVRARGPRMQKLAELRAQLAGTLGASHKKIVLPDAEIDPLADPEELEQQAQAIAETEKQLATQVAGLDAQAAELVHIADLRKHHDRANDMMLRDDDQPHRNAQPSTTGPAGPQAASPPNGQADGFAGGDRAPSFESEATFVLGEVIDRSTIESLASASRSGDPTKRADAAKLARDAVAARLDSFRKKRAQIELRAKQLRGKP